MISMFRAAIPVSVDRDKASKTVVLSNFMMFPTVKKENARELVIRVVRGCIDEAD